MFRPDFEQHQLVLQRPYFKDPWNQFDFVLVLAGYSGFLPVVGRCRLTLGFRSRPHACFQCLIPECEESLSNFASNCNLRHYSVGDGRTGGLRALRALR